MRGLVDPSGPHSSYRLFEWTMAVALTGIGILLTISPDALAVSRFAAFGLLIYQPTLAFVCLAVGLSRGTVLFMNGRLGTYSAKFRAIASFLSATVWSQLAIALILNGGVPSPGIPVYLALTLGEFRSIWRAARDQNGFFS